MAEKSRKRHGENTEKDIRKNLGSRTQPARNEPDKTKPAAR
jgi:hypothetical protein